MPDVIISRRSFLGHGIAAAAVGLGLTSPTFSRYASKEIVVIGAGLAGLVAAYELEKAGHKVTIVEAQERVGGRVLTLRDFAGGQHADAGAARIPEDHDLTHKYIKEFALELIPFYPTSGKFMRFRNGRADRTDWNGFRDATSSVMGLEVQDHWRKIKGGNDLLPRAFAERMKDRISYSSPVSRIQRKLDGVTISFAENSGRQTINADIAICAIPVTMLRKIEFSPALSNQKLNIVAKSTYDSASRIFIQTKERTWTRQGLNGFAFGDHEDEIWDASFGEAGTHGILESYSRYDYSRELTGLANERRFESVTRTFEKLFGPIAGQRIAAVSKCWNEDPWTEGAWAHLSPGEKLTFAKPEGPIYFAGEHLSFSPSWMQGALQSGLMVADQISKLPAR